MLCPKISDILYHLIIFLLYDPALMWEIFPSAFILSDLMISILHKYVVSQSLFSSIFVVYNISQLTLSYTSKYSPFNFSGVS